MSNELLKATQKYWSGRAQNYSAYTRHEMVGEQGRKWLCLLNHLIRTHFPHRTPESIEVLDVGTGAGFFATILAGYGYPITAIDCNEAMLEEASQNTRKYRKRVALWKMEAEDMFFPDESFDVVISRNVMWNMQNPEAAYIEWHRVLKKGGMLLNFDANWYRHIHYHMIHEHLPAYDIDTIDAIAGQLPASDKQRPDWDRRILEPYFRLTIDENIGLWVYDEEERKRYERVPLFMIQGIKE
ncbi:Methyltransferase domain-containing protein [Lachnospiraceae bacterium XBB1006]|nr:Methyltransferase domain-containing protein [Lachnospiraceae bacterium XBB1006]